MKFGKGAEPLKVSSPKDVHPRGVKLLYLIFSRHNDSAFYFPDISKVNLLLHVGKQQASFSLGSDTRHPSLYRESTSPVPCKKTTWQIHQPACQTLS